MYSPQFQLLCSCVLGGPLPSTQPRWTTLACIIAESALSVQAGRRRERGKFALFSVFRFIPFLIILLIQWVSVPLFVLVLFVLSFFHQHLRYHLFQGDGSGIHHVPGFWQLCIPWRSPDHCPFMSLASFFLPFPFSTSVTCGTCSLPPWGFSSPPTKREGLPVHCSDYGYVGRELQGSVTGKASENTQGLDSCLVGVGQGSGVFKLCLVRQRMDERGVGRGRSGARPRASSQERLQCGREVKSMCRKLL